MLAFLTSRLAGPLASGVALLLLVLLVSTCAGKAHQTRRADAAEMALSIAQTDLTRCQDSRKDLEGKIAVQNAAVEGLRHEASIRTAAAENAVTEALKGRAGAEARAAKLLNTPPAGLDACARAMSAFDAVKDAVR